MNNTVYTTNLIQSIIIHIIDFIYDEDVIFISDYQSEPLIEFSNDDPIIIDVISGKDLITIDFHQNLLYSCGEECCGGFSEYYTLIITKELLETIITKYETVLEN